jgi:hypothetical protein
MGIDRKRRAIAEAVCLALAERLAWRCGQSCRRVVCGYSAFLVFKLGNFRLLPLSTAIEAAATSALSRVGFHPY